MVVLPYHCFLLVCDSCHFLPCLTFVVVARLIFLSLLLVYNFSCLILSSFLLCVTFCQFFVFDFVSFVFFPGSDLVILVQTKDPHLYSWIFFFFTFTLLIAFEIMEGSSHTPSSNDKKEKEALRKQPEETETQAMSLIWLQLAILTAPFGIGQPNPAGTKRKTVKSSKITMESGRKEAEDHEKNRVGKYAQYFKGNEILPIPEIIEKLEPRILSLVVTNLKTRRLVGLKKKGFEYLLRKVGVPCQYFYRKRFVTWDVLRPSKEQAAKAASSTIITKFFRRIRVIVCNVPAFITGRCWPLSSANSAEWKKATSYGTAYGDHVFRLCLDREGFKLSRR